MPTFPKTMTMETDGEAISYERMKHCITTIPPTTEGATCEVGVRRGGCSEMIMQAFLDQGDNERIHICIDPYGQIPYTDIRGTYTTTDYSNLMKRQTLKDLFTYAFDKDRELLFFQMEDGEFYRRFPDGVPHYYEKGYLINKYAFVHIDGQHSLEAVMTAYEYFKDRMSLNGIIAFDNCNHYDHSRVTSLLVNNGYEFVESAGGNCKRMYRKVAEVVS